MEYMFYLYVLLCITITCQKNHKKITPKENQWFKSSFFLCIMMLFLHFTIACIVYWSIFYEYLYTFYAMFNTEGEIEETKSFVLWNFHKKFLFFLTYMRIKKLLMKLLFILSFIVQLKSQSFLKLYCAIKRDTFKLKHQQ